jgi:alpha-ketoglutarate-dependent dioxygenase alkB family protein 2
MNIDQSRTKSYGKPVKNKKLDIKTNQNQNKYQNQSIVSALSSFNVKTCDSTEEAKKLNRFIDLAPRFYDDLNNGLNLILFPEFLNAEIANHLFNLLMKITYRSDEESMITIMGKKYVIPRKQTAFGEKGITYSFSGISVDVDDWDGSYEDPNMIEACQIVRLIASRLTDKFGQKFNYALINKYPDNKSKIGYHADDEDELCDNPIILGLSLGQERQIYFKRKCGNEKPIKVSLPHGSLVMMGHPTNKNYKHSIPESKIKMGPRISLTFRGIDK